MSSKKNNEAKPINANNQMQESSVQQVFENVDRETASKTEAAPVSINDNKPAPHPLEKVASEEQAAAASKPTSPRKKNRGNYAKYNNLKNAMVTALVKGGKTSAEMAKDLNISQPTLHKYKNLAMVEDQQLYMTLDEKMHLQASRAKGESKSGGIKS